MSAEPAAQTLSLITPASADQSIGHSQHVHVSNVIFYHYDMCVRERVKEQMTAFQLLQILQFTHFSLIQNAFGTDSPAFIIYYTLSLFMIDEKRSKKRITKLWLLCAWSANMRSGV